MGPAGTVAVLLVLGPAASLASARLPAALVGEKVFEQDDREALTAATADNEWPEDRGEKALLGSFPFPGQRGPAQQPPGAYRQQLQQHVATSNRIDLAAPKKFELLHSLAQNETVGDTSYVKDGRRCVDKVMMVEETQYDEVLTCDHSYDNRCHTSYVTKYEPHQELDCEEKFKKICYIEYEKKAYTEKVQVCTTPFEKDCSGDRKQKSLIGTYRPGRRANPRAGDQDNALEQEEEGRQEDEQLCQTVYETECATTQTVHEVEDDVAQCKTVEEEKCDEVKEGFTTELKCDKWPREVCTLEKKKVKKYTPNTSCEKVPKKMCAPRGCGIKQGGVLCQDKLKTVVVDSPVEECDMEPIRTCKHITKLVPRLVATQECVDVPKEICARSKVNPRKVKRPAIQKWCYKLNSTDETTKSPTPDPAECQSDVDCTAGYTCVQEEGKCRARPGKVLINSITVQTASCTDCTSEGVIISLEGERIGGNNGEAPAPVPCTTGLLDRAGVSDFGTGESSRWAGSLVDDEERTMLGGCYEAPLNAMVRGGSLEWRGEGVWVPDTVCIDWKSTNMAYECRAVPKGVFFRQDSGQVGAREFALVECQDLFPHQSCEEAAEQAAGPARRG